MTNLSRLPSIDEMLSGSLTGYVPSVDNGGQHHLSSHGSTQSVRQVVPSLPTSQSLQSSPDSHIINPQERQAYTLSERLLPSAAIVNCPYAHETAQFNAHPQEERRLQRHVRRLRSPIACQGCRKKKVCLRSGLVLCPKFPDDGNFIFWWANGNSSVE